MYCPKCSQEQISDEMRFCSRCGFSLIAVMELVAASHALVTREAESQAGQVSPGQRNVRRGASMMLASLALTLFVGLLSAIDDGFAVLLLVPLLGFIIGFARVLYGVFIADKRAARKKAAASQPHLATSNSWTTGRRAAHS